MYDTLLLSLTRSGSAATQNIFQTHPQIFVADYELQSSMISFGKCIEPKKGFESVYFIHDSADFDYWQSISKCLSFKHFIYTVRNPIPQIVGIYNAALYESYLGVYSEPSKDFFFSEQNIKNVIKYTLNVINYAKYIAPKFNDVFVIDFDKLHLEHIQETSKEIYRFLGIDENASPVSSGSLSFSDVVGYLANVPLEVELGANESIKMFATFGLQSPVNSFFNKGHLAIDYRLFAFVDLESTDVSGLRNKRIYLWVDINIFKTLEFGRGSDLVQDINNSIPAAVERWIDGAVEIEREIAPKKIIECPKEAIEIFKSIAGNQIEEFLAANPTINWKEFEEIL